MLLLAARVLSETCPRGCLDSSPAVGRSVRRLGLMGRGGEDDGERLLGLSLMQDSGLGAELEEQT